MAFPTTSILDAFTRADTSDIGGSLSWTSPLFGHDPIGITSNKGSCIISLNHNNVWNQSFTDAECYVTLNDIFYSTNRVGIGVRFNGSPPNGYFLFWDYNSGTQQLSIFRYDAGSATRIAGPNTVSLSNGSKIGISVIGNSLTGYINTAGSWVSNLTVTDNTYLTAGSLWMFGRFSSTSWTVDDFGGGANVPAVTIPPRYIHLQQQGITA